MDKPVKVPSKCPKWEPYSTTKVLRIGGEGLRTVTAYFRDVKPTKKNNGTTWGPGTLTVLYDKTAPRMAPAQVGLTGKYDAGAGKFTVTFQAAGTDDRNAKTKGSGVKDYLLVGNPTKAPTARCGSAADTKLPISYSSDGKTGTASIDIPASEVSKYKLRLCARDKVGLVSPGVILAAKP